MTVPYLADINFWLALTFRKHPHSPSAWKWMDQQGPATCFMCRMTQQGFLRLATNAKAISEPLTHHQAWSAYDKFLSDERIEFLEEPPDIETAWRGYSITRKLFSKGLERRLPRGICQKMASESPHFRYGFHGLQGSLRRGC